MQEDVKRIPLKNLIADPNQPRKHFDEGHIADLAHSISQYDVIHPIMVRPIKSQNKGKYMIVVGECRFRAAGLAMLVDIPCTIRVLTDSEALEIQITENLQRENVNPMDEADAFQSIIKGGQYKAKELAARLGKRVEYVLQRLKLCDLIPAFQDLVYADKLLLSQANNICKFSADVQQGFFDSKVPADWMEKPAGWKLQEVYFGSATHNLDEATFQTEDPKLNPKMGPCNSCRFNSFVSELPFEGKENQRICSNPSCYEIKTKNAFNRKVKELSEEEDVVFVAGYTYNDEAKKRVATAEATGKEVLSENQYQILKAPEAPKALPDFETYKAKNEWNDDASEEEMLEDYKQEQEEYEGMLDDYQEELKEYEEKKQYAKKAYVVAGHRSEGQMVDIVVRGAETGNGAKDVALEDKISEMKRSLDTTNKNARINFLKKELIPGLEAQPVFYDRESELEMCEWFAIFHLLYEGADYKMREQVRKDFGNDKLNLAQMISTITLTGKTGLLFKWMRRLLLHKLAAGKSFEYDSDGLDSAELLAKNILGRYMKGQLEQLLTGYRQKQLERKEKLDEKIAALRQTEIPVDA